MKASDKEIIKKVFGNWYSRPITEHLNKLNFTNANGQPYNMALVKEFITNTKRKNAQLEAIIMDFTLDFAKKEKRRKKALQNAVNQNPE